MEALTFNNTYSLKKKLNSGSFGDVYLTIDIKAKEKYAIKLEAWKFGSKKPTSVKKEQEILMSLQGIKGIPKLIWFGNEHGQDALVITLLEKDLAAIIKKRKTISLKSTIMIADQLLTIIENMHNKGYIHRDIKPENILLGKGIDQKTVQLIDYGISKKYRDSGNKHISMKKTKMFIGNTNFSLKIKGTIRQASAIAHKKLELSRRDDLESFGYVLLFLLNGSLPWQNLDIAESEKAFVVGSMKQATPPNQLCKGLPQELEQYFKQVKNLKFDENPDQTQIRTLFQTMAKKNKFVYDWNWDWSETALTTEETINLKLADSKYSLQPKRSSSTIPQEKEYDDQLSPPRKRTERRESKGSIAIDQEIIRENSLQSLGSFALDDVDLWNSMEEWAENDFHVFEKKKLLEKAWPKKCNKLSIKSKGIFLSNIKKLMKSKSHVL